MTSSQPIKLIECPRDAMQGIHNFIATEDKINYLNLLLKVGFDTLDFGSFVSPKAVPQMADTAEVLSGLDLSGSATRLLAIVANMQGVDNAMKHSQISFLGYPFSISETFQKRNTNSDRNSALALVGELVNKCEEKNKQAVIYLSMAFGNPYGDEWSEDLVCDWTQELVNRGAKIIALSDTIGASSAESVSSIYQKVNRLFGNIEIGVHLHSRPENWKEKIEAAYNNGCRRFDSAIKGFGGCPMAADELVGNIATENLIAYFSQKGEQLALNKQAFNDAMAYSSKIFNA
jgi:hydroxymethylglutaryl-CoA lyase